MSTDPAVTAAARAACDGSHGWTQPCDMCVEFAERAVPRVRERIAADIEDIALVPGNWPGAEQWDAAVEECARIARGDLA